VVGVDAPVVLTDPPSVVLVAGDPAVGASSPEVARATAPPPTAALTPTSSATRAKGRRRCRVAEGMRSSDTPRVRVV
jgi:hypothetical protein